MRTAKIYVVLGLREDAEAWRREQGLAPNEVVAVSPARYTGVLRGLSLDCEVITLASWSKASPELVAAIETDLQLVRATRGRHGE